MLPDTMADSIFELASSNPDFLIVDETDKLLFWDHLVGLISVGELEPLYLKRISYLLRYLSLHRNYIRRQIDFIRNI